MTEPEAGNVRGRCSGHRQAARLGTQRPTQSGELDPHRPADEPETPKLPALSPHSKSRVWWLFTLALDRERAREAVAEARAEA